MATNCRVHWKYFDGNSTWLNEQPMLGDYESGQPLTMNNFVRSSLEDRIISMMNQ